MPKIRRYHPLSHDFNHDMEVRELRSKFGDWMGYGWQEILSIADRNNGFVKGELDQIATYMARASLSKRLDYPIKQARLALGWMLDRGWIRLVPTEVEGSTMLLPTEVEGSAKGQPAGIEIVNFAEYHRTREPKQPPSETSETSETSKYHKNDTLFPLKAAKTKMAYPENFTLSDELFEWCKNQHVGEIQKHLDAFRDYHIAKGSRFIDWNAAFRTWIRNVHKFNRWGNNGKAEQQGFEPKGFASLKEALQRERQNKS